MIRRMGMLVAGLVGLAFWTGCEWTGSGSEDSWNDSYSWVNFSGTYQLYNSVATGGGSNVTQIAVSNEGQGATSLGQLNYNGTLTRRPVVAGSVTINIGGISFHDNGSGGLTGGNGGTITYATGQWSAQLAENIAQGSAIAASYSYLATSSSAISGDRVITVLTVNQTGNMLSMRDNNGVVYSGKVTGASVPGDTSAPASNVRLVFEVRSENGAKINGTLSGDWSGAGEGGAGTLSNRHLEGTYISGKHTEEIRAASGSVSLTPTPIIGP